MSSKSEISCKAASSINAKEEYAPRDEEDEVAIAVRIHAPAFASSMLTFVKQCQGFDASRSSRSDTSSIERGGMGCARECGTGLGVLASLEVESIVEGTEPHEGMVDQCFVGSIWIQFVLLLTENSNCEKCTLVAPEWPRHLAPPSFLSVTRSKNCHGHSD